MYKQLEDYLAKVAWQFGSLPKQRCDDELKEMREHLLNAVIANQELGQSDETAVANALMAFGTPEEVGANVLWAWRRHLWEVSRKTFSKIAGMWSLFYAFMMMTYAPTPHDQARIFYFWASSMIVLALLILLPNYLRTRTQSPLLSSVQRSR